MTLQILLVHFFMDNEGTLKQICDDEGITVLVDQLRKQSIACIYVKFSVVKNDKRIPQALLVGFKSDVELDVRKTDESDNGNNLGEDNE